MRIKELGVRQFTVSEKGVAMPLAAKGHQYALSE